jgi:hypothetical protein
LARDAAIAALPDVLVAYLIALELQQKRVRHIRWELQIPARVRARRY